MSSLKSNAVGAPHKTRFTPDQIATSLTENKQTTMADIKTATSEGIELQTQPKKATAVQASSADEELIDIGKALDVKEAGRAGDGAVPVVTPDVPQEETTVVDANANKKHRGCVSGVKRKHMRTVAKYLIVSTICVLLATVIGLAIRVSLGM